MRIGRHPENQMVLELEGVSACHAELELKPALPTQDPLTVRDLSKHGTGIRPGPTMKERWFMGIAPAWEPLKKGVAHPVDNAWQLLVPLRPLDKEQKGAWPISVWVKNRLTAAEVRDLDGEPCEQSAMLEAERAQELEQEAAVRAAEEDGRFAACFEPPPPTRPEDELQAAPPSEPPPPPADDDAVDDGAADLLEEQLEVAARPPPPPDAPVPASADDWVPPPPDEAATQEQPTSSAVSSTFAPPGSAREEPSPCQAQPPSGLQFRNDTASEAVGQEPPPAGGKRPWWMIDRLPRKSKEQRLADRKAKFKTVPWWLEPRAPSETSSSSLRRRVRARKAKDRSRSDRPRRRRRW